MIHGKQEAVRAERAGHEDPHETGKASALPGEQLDDAPEQRIPGWRMWLYRVGIGWLRSGGRIGGPGGP
jgi:hypothetical protein